MFSKFLVLAAVLATATAETPVTMEGCTIKVNPCDLCALDELCERDSTHAEHGVCVPPPQIVAFTTDYTNLHSAYPTNTGQCWGDQGNFIPLSGLGLGYGSILKPASDTIADCLDITNWPEDAVYLVISTYLAPPGWSGAAYDQRSNLLNTDKEAFMALRPWKCYYYKNTGCVSWEGSDENHQCISQEARIEANGHHDGQGGTNGSSQYGVDCWSTVWKRREAV